MPRILVYGSWPREELYKIGRQLGTILSDVIGEVPISIYVFFPAETEFLNGDENVISAEIWAGPVLLSEEVIKEVGQRATKETERLLLSFHYAKAWYRSGVGEL